MKKITLLVSNLEREQTLSSLRRMGIVHIQHVQAPSGADISQLEEKLENIDRAQTALIPFKKENSQERNLEKGKEDWFIKEVLALQKEQQSLESKIPRLEQQLSWYDTWGNVSSKEIQALREAGVFVKVYICPKKELKKIAPGRLIVPLKEKGNSVYTALVSYGNEEKLTLIEVEVPQENRQDIEKELARTDKRLKEILAAFIKSGCYCAALSTFRKNTEKELEFLQVRIGMGTETKFSYVKGFCPVSKTSALIDRAHREKWAYVIEEADTPEEVPTLIKNPRWIEIIKPVFQFMGTVPGYREFDISVWFLFFFSLFFAMLIGDAGYGLLFLGATLYAKKKIPSFQKEPFWLLIVLSVSTCIWGAITGTWFGFEQLARLPVLKQLIIPRLSSFSGNPPFLMNLCFFIGAVQLSIAHAMRVIRYFPDLRSWAQIGWIQITWGIFFIAGNLVLGKEFPDFARYFLMVGIGLVILFSYPQKNMLKGILISIANLPLSVIGSFADTLSYLRLFAVGFASVMVAVSFNEMALGVGFHGILSSFFAALILFLGHALNIILGLMSVLVHGIRLNMLEFSGHLDMEWAGREYKPFRE
ncbi:MAG: hypothetical protein JXD21_03265 [Candidatus Omnitrophica bacterium]|nr:hypothetical protein [Candidatus Omnitrophota bacterium]